MLVLLWPKLALGIIGLFLSADGASAQSGFRLASSPAYRDVEVCPNRCFVSGPSTGNWSVHPDFKQIKKCKQSMFYDFSLYDPVDDEESTHRIHACSSFGPDFSVLPATKSQTEVLGSVNVDFEMGWWNEGFGLAASGIRSLMKQLRTYLEQGYGTTDRPFIMFAQSGQATVGLYIGQGLLYHGLASSALKTFQNRLVSFNTSTPSLAMQLCGPRYDSSHVFGIMATSNGSFSAIQDAIKGWNNASCLSFSESDRLAGEVELTTPLVQANGSTNSTVAARFFSRLHSRADCKTVQVESGDSCAKLASKCGISAADFTKYNSASSFCSTLKPKQHVCCSSGSLPDFSPSPNPDGSCHSYQVKPNDNCDDLAAQFSLTRQKLEDFNKKTWGWNGCQLLFIDTIMCLSKGTPPFPAEIANAVCGPQKPGSKPPTDGSDIAKLNPCPLNACCNIWGQCGITRDFCIDTNTGAPGTAKPGTYGCISNCGMDVVKGDGGGSIRVGYFEGYGMGRDCLYQDASQIDSSAYTHIHFAFGTLTADYEVQTGDELSSYQFSQFKLIKNARKVLSFGGWDFSTFPATYAIFRNGVTPANRLKMATNIANFIKKHNLDGVDIDWEYPGAPDLPGIPPASKDDGPNYLAFLVILKNLLPGKSVSIAAPSSYWYLKQYPIKEIGKVVDYIVYMTYDLHGQWDADNANSQEACDTGKCLRSQVNLTETKQSLAMITKAGVPGSKVIVGVTSYGRSFKMAEAGCWGPNCQFIGDRLNSQATKGVCTGTAGYIADAEIAEIMNDKRRVGRVTTSFLDPTSNSDILVYDDNQWVSYMSASTKKTRTSLYTAWGMGGTTDWATDLQKYHDVPHPASSWAVFKERAQNGENPKSDDSRNGGWTDLNCDDEYVNHKNQYSAQERWKGLKAAEAWRDVRRIYEDTDRNTGITFISSVLQTLKAETGSAECGSVLPSGCQAIGCPQGANGPLSGPAAELIWNALTTIHNMHAAYHQTLFNAVALSATALDNLEDNFAPIPPEPDNTWLLLVIDLVTLGTLSAAGPFFNTFLKSLPYFAKAAGSTLDNAKDTTMTIIGQSTTIAKDMLADPKGSDWKPENQRAFSNFMGQVVNGWANVTAKALEELFRGTPEALDRIEKAIADGKLNDGSGQQAAGTADEPTLRANIQKSFFAYAIPALWKVSSAWAFVVDSGFGCNVDKPLKKYLDDKTMDATGYCFEGNMYYLVRVEGNAQDCGEGGCLDRMFSTPPGLDSLDGTNFGGVTKEILIKGSVRTYIQNGKKNGGGGADVGNRGTINDLLDVDVTTPGFIRLPVCSPERAFQSWDTSSLGSSPNFPCDIPPGKDECGESSFENQSSDASPSVSDCLQIIKNIEGDGTTEWTTQVVGKRQREIAKYGSCQFGVEATEVNGNVEFYVGGQDVIDIINESIKRFGGSGKVGAKGDMKCNGNIKKQGVKWGLY
ncbi:uncharacterized protein E0L32_010163 [Thyridium curvatum]|uniref:chitinase n=1 Tax=Thyridium curvatum TaxID=1093900 RepID=A0A507AN89_9PEZI|nr:uncharacterized protein E0L32_010163 [Thyridium curvatum]TPX08096.1 hypothetical protein E0L32_010163 [Thyridium curvatum]